MSAALRPLDIAHAGLLAGMHHVCFREPWNAQAMTELLRMPGAFGWLDGESPPRGFVLARQAADEAEILTLLVLPPFRRRGLARRLLAAAAGQARSLGASRLLLEVAANNSAAIALYTDLSFHPVGRRPGYYGGHTDALLMARSLSSDFSITNLCTPSGG